MTHTDPRLTHAITTSNAADAARQPEVTEAQ